jgi:hypothetical protein
MIDTVDTADINSHKSITPGLLPNNIIAEHMNSMSEYGDGSHAGGPVLLFNMETAKHTTDI